MDSCFSECRRAHKSTNLQCQRLESPIEVQGQGDCKCNSDFQRPPKFWISSDEGKKFKTKVREESDSDSKPEEEKFSDAHYDCFLKRDLPDKYNQEKDFKSLSSSWTSPYSRWVSHTKPAVPSEQLSRNQYNSPEETSEKFYEFQQKVEFLFRIFKEYEQKFSQGHGQSDMTKAVGGVTGNVFHLFNLNTRMCTVEEGIGKLASILEDMLKNNKKGKMPLFPEESLLFSDPSNFDDMNMTQRVNYLKNKNDLLKSLIKGFFNADSVEDIRSRMASLSKEYEFKKTTLNSNVDFEDGRRTKDSNVDEIMESLKKLQKQMTEVQSKKCQIFEPAAPKSEKREEPATKFPAQQDNKLEVISEQAELAFSEDTEPEADDIEEKNLIRNFKEKLTEFKEKFQENNMSGHDLSTRLSAQEAELLNSSLKKFQFELFSSLDTAGKKVFKTNVKDIRISAREEPLKRQTKTDESTNRVPENVEIPENPIVDLNRNNSKFLKHEESTEAIKVLRNSIERVSINLGKQTDTEIGKKLLEPSECKINLTRKIPQKNNLRSLACYTKAKRGRCLDVEDRSPVREHSRSVEREERPRPATEPRTPRKSLPLSLLKPPVPEFQKKNSGITNVKNKNKILLSKKPFVQTP